MAGGNGRTTEAAGGSEPSPLPLISVPTIDGQVVEFTLTDLADLVRGAACFDGQHPRPAIANALMALFGVDRDLATQVIEDLAHLAGPATTEAIGALVRPGE